MLVLGIDIASRTGLAWYDTTKGREHIVAITHKFPDISVEDKAWSIGYEATELISQYGRPDLAMIEERAHKQYKKSGLDGLLHSHVLHGAFLSALGAQQINYETVSVNTWRTACYGFSRGVDNWKQYARQACEREGIKVANHDQAEAVWISVYGATCSEHSQQMKYRAAVA